jgi:hypothetical protein
LPANPPKVIIEDIACCDPAAPIISTKLEIIISELAIFGDNVKKLNISIFLAFSFILLYFLDTTTFGGAV